ncbi:Phototropin-1B [Lachnellula suecica]|uniref:Phototropin-1B n=1 Tax=Lachnellula suecica TaxID=602035 RepID=A0A8T9C8X1_9HELO|nr:Phototropin-1B [Lachnellula suecica]
MARYQGPANTVSTAQITRDPESTSVPQPPQVHARPDDPANSINGSVPLPSIHSTTSSYANSTEHDPQESRHGANPKSEGANQSSNNLENAALPSVSSFKSHLDPIKEGPAVNDVSNLQRGHESHHGISSKPQAPESKRLRSSDKAGKKSDTQSHSSRSEGISNISKRLITGGVNGNELNDTKSDTESYKSEDAISVSTRPTTGGMNGNNITDFFGSEVFHIVLRNPTTAHRLLRFCQSRACGENMEFLQKVTQYNRLLDEASQLLGSIHSTYTSADAPRQIHISNSQIKRISSDIRQASQLTIPALENIFIGAQEDIESLLAREIYPRFVKHQVTASATMALANHRERFQGLGDCFCMTDPNIADNPILYASDGFISVTGYNRKDIIPRNCRFLQGDLTDPKAPKRLRTAIENCDETVELLLNYRKNGDPFWNLLYVSPLLDERGDVSFFLGGQINCSTTIHSCNDILKVLSLNDDELDDLETAVKSRPTPRTRDSFQNAPKAKSSFFKSWRKYNPASTGSNSTGNTAAENVVVRGEAGMESELINRHGKMGFRTQVEAFYTAYSKYIALEYNAQTQTLFIKHYSPGIIDMLCLNLPNGGIAPIFNKDIFKVLSEHTPSSSSSSTSKAFKQTVKGALQKGKAVSLETGLLTGFAEKKKGGLFGGEKEGGLRRVEEKYVTHWTPLKDEEARVKWVILTIAPKD